MFLYYSIFIALGGRLRGEGGKGKRVGCSRENATLRNVRVGEQSFPNPNLLCACGSSLVLSHNALITKPAHQFQPLPPQSVKHGPEHHLLWAAQRQVCVQKWASEG
jgi:hypothetical protein